MITAPETIDLGEISAILDGIAAEVSAALELDSDVPKAVEQLSASFCALINETVALVRSTENREKRFTKFEAVQRHLYEYGDGRLHAWFGSKMYLLIQNLKIRIATGDAPIDAAETVKKSMNLQGSIGALQDYLYEFFGPVVRDKLILLNVACAYQYRDLEAPDHKRLQAYDEKDIQRILAELDRLNGSMVSRLNNSKLVEKIFRTQIAELKEKGHLEAVARHFAGGLEGFIAARVKAIAEHLTA